VVGRSRFQNKDWGRASCLESNKEKWREEGCRKRGSAVVSPVPSKKKKRNARGLGHFPRGGKRHAATIPKKKKEEVPEEADEE